MWCLKIHVSISKIVLNFQDSKFSRFSESTFSNDISNIYFSKNSTNFLSIELLRSPIRALVQKLGKLTSRPTPSDGSLNNRLHMIYGYNFSNHCPVCQNDIRKWEPDNLYDGVDICLLGTNCLNLEVVGDCSTQETLRTLPSMFLLARITDSKTRI